MFKVIKHGFKHCCSVGYFSNTSTSMHLTSCGSGLARCVRTPLFLSSLKEKTLHFPARLWPPSGMEISFKIKFTLCCMSYNLHLSSKYLNGRVLCVLCLTDRLNSQSAEGNKGEQWFKRRTSYEVVFFFFFFFLCHDVNADELSPLTVFALSDRSQFTVWTGDLVKGDRVLFQISIRSLASPFLPHRL